MFTAEQFHAKAAESVRRKNERVTPESKLTLSQGAFA
jgi:hypothetical protein